MIWIFREASKRHFSRTRIAQRSLYVFLSYIDWTTRIISKILLAKKPIKHTHLALHPSLLNPTFLNKSIPLNTHFKKERGEQRLRVKSPRSEFEYHHIFLKNALLPDFHSLLSFAKETKVSKEKNS